MQLTIYRIGRLISFNDFDGADEITLQVPDGTELGRFGRLGLVAFVPSDSFVRTMHEAADVLLRAQARQRGFRVVDEVMARDRAAMRRVDYLRRRA